MNVTEWLGDLGLKQYATAFRENEIDERVLPSLTADDLKELGVTLIGHRRLLLDAIAALREPELKQAAAGLPAAQPQPAASSAEAERRQLTVMFCDIVGSTALSTQFDPEDLRDLINAYHHAVAETVARFDGFVAKYMGDGVLIYFGYPQAHEDDAERAVRAGLAAIDAVAALAGAVTLRVRIGIATGVAVVGDLIGAGAAQERGVVGETPNLAARVQGLAEPNTIVIADATRRQIGGLFDLTDLGPKMLAGFAEPQPVWQVLGESAVQSRFEALRSGTTPLVGRVAECDFLVRQWSEAKTGAGKAVVLSGEPGIGKSRLTAALHDRIGDEPWARMRWYCAPHRQSSALYPIVVRLEQVAGFARDDTPEQKRAKLADALITDACHAEDTALLGELLSVPGLAPDPDPNPIRKRERTFEALSRQLTALARRGPVLLEFEDVHWIDPTSRELLDRMVERVRDLPALLLVTCRPEFQHDWHALPHVTLMELTRLQGEEGTGLVRRLMGTAHLSEEMIAEIVARTDGVPLFVEELTKAVLESADSGDRVAAVLSAAPLTGLAVPAALHASLMARLDRLGPAVKEIAEIGAVLGREFPHDLIVPVARWPDAELHAALDRLCEAGLLVRHGTGADMTYAFSHALVHDAAYGTLLRERRRELHGRAADALLSAAGQARDAKPEVIARHLQSAGRAGEAIAAWREAGDAAVRREANREAAQHFRHALTLVEAEPENEARWRIELAVLSQLAPPLMALLGWSSPETGAVVERAAEVGRRLESSPEIAPAIANLWVFNNARGRFDRAEEISHDLTRIARETGDADIMLQAYHCSWAINFTLGRFAAAAAHVDAGAAIYDETRHAHHRHIYLGHDPGVCLLNFGAAARSLLGFPDQARRLAEDGVARARRLGHPPSLAHALFSNGTFHAARGEAVEAIATAREVLSLADTHGFPEQRAIAEVSLGWGQTRLGQIEEGLALMRRGIQAMDRVGAAFQLTNTLGLLADGLLTAGQYEEGFVAICRAFEVYRQTGEACFLSRLYRLRGELILHLHGTDDRRVESDLHQALTVAREQDAKAWELPATIRLARLWGEAGRRAEARDLLAPVHGWFTEGFDTADLKEARALLDELV